MVADRLNALCDGFAACTTVAFADLGSQMVLVANTAASTKRETLDKLCAQAGVMLAPPSDPSGTLNPATLAYLADAAHTKVFLRATDEPNDILICDCTHDIDLDAFVAAAQTCLADITGGPGT